MNYIRVQGSTPSIVAITEIKPKHDRYFDTKHIPLPGYNPYFSESMHRGIVIYVKNGIEADKVTDNSQ